MSVLSINDHQREELDFNSFKLEHTITNSDLNLEIIKEVIADLPLHQIAYASDSLELQADFEKILSNKSQILDAEAMTANLMRTNSYIALNNVQTHPRLKNLCDKVTRNISRLYGQEVKGASYWIFVASPGAITPFHFDRFSNFIFQVRGTKELAVFPNFNDEVTNHTDCEKYCSGISVNTPWNEAMDSMATKYHFSPGQAVHIPFTSAHYVKNGTQDISITISVFYHSKRTLTWSRAMRFNHAIRNLLKPRPIRKDSKINFIKAYLLPIAALIRGL